MRIRFYFNRRGSLPWSVDLGSQASEVNVKTVVLEDVSAYSAYDPLNSNRRAPTGWFEVPDGNLTIVAGHAFIRRTRRKK